MRVSRSHRQVCTCQLALWPVFGFAVCQVVAADPVAQEDPCHRPQVSDVAICEGKPGVPLDWKLGLGDLKNPVEYVLPAAMAERKIEETADEMTATWKGHPVFGAAFVVQIRWRRDSEGLWHGALGYEGYEGNAFVEEIHFPVVEGDLQPDSKLIFGGSDCGLSCKVRQVFKPGSKWLRPYDGGLQMAAVVHPERPSLYLDHRDPAWNAKSCEFTVSKDGARFSLAGIHYPGTGEKPRSSDRIPYESSLGQFTGDWFEAGQIYKKWGAAQGRNARRPAGNPLRKIGMWVWNRGLIADVIPPVERLQKELGDIPVALDWYWWHSNPYDTDYPDFWPPREGVEPFRAAIARLKGQGIYSQVYINGVCWDLDGKSWSEGGDESAVFVRDGRPLSHAFNKYNLHRLGYMCGEAPKFQERISSLVGHLRQCGLDGQYLDMIGCATCKRCYNPAHRHPKGGGASGPPGYRALLERLRRENPGYALTTESCTEPYMDLLDGAIVCNSTSYEHLGGGFGGERIPLFQSVYHGQFAYFGNYAHPDGITPWDPLWPPEHRWKTEKPWHKLYPHQFYLELGRTVSWGAQPMVCNIKQTLFTDPDFAEIRRFVLEIARFYHANRAHLFDGEMLNPAGFSCATQSVEFLARMIFTKEDQCRVIRRDLPAILHSCWRAPDGSRALILINYTEAPQDWTFRGLSGTVPPHSCERRLLP